MRSILKKNSSVIICFLGFVYFSSFLTDCNRPEKNNSNPPGPPPTVNDSTFINPLLEHGADPWVVKKDSVYYFMSTAGSRIDIRKTKYVSDLREVPAITIWTPPSGTDHSKSLWAPEMHYLDGKWYMYFAASDGTDADRRMNVLECNSQDPLTVGSWSYKAKLVTNPDYWAIDGSVFQYNSNTYMIWSGWKGTDVSNSGHQQLYIAKMKNPWTLEGDRVMISEPEYAWEKHGDVNEGPEILVNHSGNIFLIYSASGCWTDNYCLGMLALKQGGDPMNRDDWTKSPDPLLSTDAYSGAFGTGHCGFFKSPDNTEDWIIYHANPNAGQDCDGYRSPRMQKVFWSQDGMPSFGKPVAIGKPLLKPSGSY